MAYSTNLRQRVVTAVKKGLPRTEVVTLFQVSLAAIKRWLTQERDEGHLKPQYLPGPPARLLPEQYEQLHLLIEKSPDALLQEYCDLWFNMTGHQVSISTMCRTLQRAKLTRKRTLSAWERDE